jgi:hypothetical protein
MMFKADSRMTRWLVWFLGPLALVFVVTLVHVPKASADVKAVETIECDPDTDTLVSAQGPATALISGSSCTTAMVTLSQNHFDFDKARGPEEIDRHSESVGTENDHAYYLMIFWED